MTEKLDQLLDEAELLINASERIKILEEALEPFAKCARGEILNPTPDDWKRAKDTLSP